jgi:hypothetical protein
VSVIVTKDSLGFNKILKGEKAFLKTEDFCDFEWTPSINSAKKFISEDDAKTFISEIKTSYDQVRSGVTNKDTFWEHVFGNDPDGTFVIECIELVQKSTAVFKKSEL